MAESWGDYIVLVRCSVGRDAPLLACALVAMLLAGCGTHTPKGQVIATADGKEITSAQLQTVLNDVPPNSAGSANTSAVVQSLIDETLFMAEAEKAGLDRDPAVAREIDKARRAVLAKAYLRQIAPPTPVANSEIANYYAAHPMLFSDRHRYVITEVTARGGKGLDQFVKPLGTSLTLDQLTERLRRDGTSFSVQGGQTSSDEMPDSLAKQFAALTVGQFYSYRTGAYVHFGRIEAINSAPASLTEAHDRIAARITGARMEETTRSRLAALRGQGNVQIGELGQKLINSGVDLDSDPAEPGSRPASKAVRQRAIAHGLDGV